MTVRTEVPTADVHTDSDAVERVKRNALDLINEVLERAVTTDTDVSETRVDIIVRVHSWTLTTAPRKSSEMVGIERSGAQAEMHDASSGSSDVDEEDTLDAFLWRIKRQRAKVRALQPKCAGVESQAMMGKTRQVAHLTHRDTSHVTASEAYGVDDDESNTLDAFLWRVKRERARSRQNSPA
eukprot:TRINITY_DN30709_c0_g1_i1.p1 TRINITY_DN30709_c0_g1~~TRINITY_DN30709_c0_g1_i1.p1  ORF type:complete len:182 (-),score=24.83 TRINITY_DN30709_c0_g1_i1:1074-1619(-)